MHYYIFSLCVYEANNEELNEIKDYDEFDIIEPTKNTKSGHTLQSDTELSHTIYNLLTQGHNETAYITETAKVMSK